ncbi:S8 family peptidase [Roseivirga pacifica]|uniref:S8 family peptidase n=1 Tax=Roseivirga pacifica TaxID=1267423 RepID=UPI002096126D|nr:S8 family peptidase [Roseivirga pacifica]MCO6359345.1 S8 family serine peptidase [Roseivirga pacifica]MCO6366715.1 S8 family serine peptidase [Roseivirga pacifica]MCO6370753.1 S8 family serine peptidase [Roseivirga pacifica]MCO6374371.1 S8 family serine peptidase [Roseivirga pacifica]MCO6379630.1 S8 family serine peptidase [Roseivirga pacifica]
MKKYMLLALLCAGLSVQAQEGNQAPPKNWFNLDPVNDQVNGVSTEKAYKELLVGKQSKKVLVAVIDSGIDVLHEDLKDVVWVNTDEIPGNGIDDDNNGYIDDIHGWNFIGGKNGENVDKDTYEVTREYKRLRPKYEGKTADDFKRKERAEFEYWLEVKEAYEADANEAVGQSQLLRNIDMQLTRYKKLFEAYLFTDELTYEDVKSVSSTDQVILMGQNILTQLYMMTDTTIHLDTLSMYLQQDLEHYAAGADYSYNLDYNPREIVGDNPDQLDEKGYGNNDVIGKGTDNFHGTHVAGIIAAKRGNGLGIDGVANNVEIMAIRAVPDGDERDKDVANAIRYAVDNGAQVVNMSFGKAFSPNTEYVYEAIQYAHEKGVILVHAAGNSAADNDEVPNFPNDYFGRKGNWSHWIEVGASSWGGEGNYVGNFSNYGKDNVDVFAPGVAIYSLAPGNEYKDAQGTSMASPVTAGVAALLLSYYPDLNPEQVKDILIKSSRSLNNLEVSQPGTGEMVKFSDLSVSGGIVNAYEALKMAESMSLKGKK